MTELSDYKVTFSQHRIFKTWTWEAESTKGDTLHPIATLGFGSRAAAETNALRAIEIACQRETLDGDALKQRVSERAA